MKLSKHFSLSELIRTNTGIKNYPNDTQLENLDILADEVLEPLRELFGKPINVNSGFRSKKVNRAVGGARSSQHVKGQAADITAGSKEENEKLFNLIKDNLVYDQLINEKNFS